MYKTDGQCEPAACHRELSAMPCDDLEGRIEVGVGGRAKREGTYAYIQLVHFTVQQKLTKCCKATIFQFLKNILQKKYVQPMYLTKA